MIKKIKNDFWPISFFAALAVLLLWQMLLPGYILTLDMIFTPQIKAMANPGDFYNTLPLEYLMQLITYFLPGWLLQKIILFFIFFGAGYLAYKFLPVPSAHFLPYWAGLFYVVNPFVYTRFLAGQWLQLAAYALLPLVFYLIIRFFQTPKNKISIFLALILALVGLFSLNFIVMILVILAVLIFVFSCYQLWFKKSLVGWSKPGLIGALIFIAAISYWFLPYSLTQPQSIFTTFGQENFEAFKTASDNRLGTIFNVASLFGYWGEEKPWAEYFLWPKDNFLIWFTLALVIIGLVVNGIYYCFTQSEKKKEAIIFLISGFLAFIFSCGLGETIFRGLNQFLFDHLWFWAGFRDTQKWSGILVLSYVYFASFGLYNIFLLFKEQKQLLYYLSLFSFLIPALYTYTIWGGFSRQLKPVWYPDSWYQVNHLLNQDDNYFRVLFLPWHAYLSLNFNQQLITQNPAKDFFDQEIIQGENMELGQIYNQSQDPLNQRIESILVASRGQLDQETLKRLTEEQIKYIIFSSGLETANEPLKFRLLSGENLKPIFSSQDLTLFEIMVR